MRNIDNIKLIEGYLSGLSCQELAVEFKCTPMTVYKKLIGNNVLVRKKWQGRTLKLPETLLSDTHQQIIDGCLLGDGSVLCKNERSTAHFYQTTIHEEFANHLCEVLPFQKLRIRKRNRRNVIFHGKIYKCNDAYNVVSTADKSLNLYRKTWYPDNKKIVPQNLKLFPTTVKYWFYGDGSTSFIPYKNVDDAYVRISLCTNNFSVDDCESLVGKLKKIGLDFHIYLSRKQPMLVAVKSSTIRDFFDYIKECSVQCFNYKWKLPKSGACRVLGWKTKQLEDALEACKELIKEPSED